MRENYAEFKAFVLMLLAGCGGTATDSGVGTGPSPMAATSTVAHEALIRAPPIFAKQCAELITFDNVSSSSVINTQYQPAVTLNNIQSEDSQGYPIVSSLDVYALQDIASTAPATCSPCGSSGPPSCAPSGNDVSIAQPPAVDPLFSGQMGGVQAVFAQPVSWVAIMAKPSVGIESLGTPGNLPYMVAFSPSGAYLGQTLYPYPPGSDASPGWGSWAQLVFTAPAGETIGSVLFTTQAWSNSAIVYGEFDNLSYSAPPGSVFVVDSTTTLFSFDAVGNRVASVALPGSIGNINGGGIAVAGSQLYVTSGQPTNHVSSYNLATLQPVTMPFGAFSGLDVPRGIAYDPGTSEFFVGNGGSQVTTYNASGGAVSATGGFPGQYGPSGVAYDADDGTIWVANYVGAPHANPPGHWLAEYTSTGVLAQSFNYGTAFLSPGAHQEPYSVTVCPEAVVGSTTVVVGFIDDGSNLGTGAVHAYTINGKAVGGPFSGPISKPYALSCDANGTVWIADETGLYRGSTTGQNLGLPGAFAGLVPPIYGVYTAP